MLVYTVDAFTDIPLGGNPAGVVICDRDMPDEEVMRQTAAKVGYSETAFVKRLDESTFRVRYFTPVEEVQLCGHATVGTFSLLLQKGIIEGGKTYTAKTNAGDIAVDVKNGLVWLDMASPKEMGGLSAEDEKALLAMYGLKEGDYGALRPALVDTGLPDIILPLASRGLLAALKPDMAAISALSEKLNVTGVHAFALEDGIAYCRNFAPLYGIDEESATGTSNGALTYYLYNRTLIAPGEQNLFIQGEAMGKPSKIYSILSVKEDGSAAIRVGGSAVVRE
ncbi:MAG: PhzF family phenazine biosynthesis protein [Clostridia bacterium]|nr:PhzF family phenazine biosynthesis protein [Clostridia bacterium]